VYLARADGTADALAGAGLAAGPVLLVPPCGSLPGAVRQEITRLAPDRVLALGGPDAVCDALLAEAAAP
jgi:putative cell wall-binding protein